jgi:hypothetical protein
MRATAGYLHTAAQTLSFPRTSQQLRGHAQRCRSVAVDASFIIMSPTTDKLHGGISAQEVIRKASTTEQRRLQTPSEGSQQAPAGFPVPFAITYCTLRSGTVFCPTPPPFSPIHVQERQFPCRSGVRAKQRLSFEALSTALTTRTGFMQCSFALCSLSQLLSGY